MSHKSFNNPIGGYTNVDPMRKHCGENNIKEYLLLLNEKISLMSMKFDNFQSRNEKLLKDINYKNKILSSKIDELYELISDNQSIPTMNENDGMDDDLQSDMISNTSSEYSFNDDFLEDDFQKNCNKNNNSTKMVGSNEKKSKRQQINNNKDFSPIETEENGKKPKRIFIKFNGKNNNSFNPLDFIMNLSQSLKQKEEPKEIDSDEEYDDKFKIYDDNDDVTVSKDYININETIENVNDIIKMGEKYIPLIDKNKEKKTKRDEKKRRITSSDSDSDDVFDVFDIKKNNNNKLDANIESNGDEFINKFCKFYTINGKKYNVDLQKVCELVQPLKKLNRMVGLKNVKEQIFEMIIYYLQGFENENKNMLHSVIEGPPGVGKTKLGKIMSQIYCALGIIPSNRFKYVKATDLIGDHVGATKHMTQSVIDDADGGVLFIDEAYALGTSESKDPYGKECMDTLNFNLSENKKKLIVIIAGYPEQLDKCFFSHNPGLQRRFPFRYKVDKYNASELSEIFKDKVKRYKWKINNEITSKYLEDFFRKNIDEFKNFGGDIENFFKKCQFSHSKRTIGLHPAYRGKLTIEDMNNGFKTFKQNKKKEDGPPLGMFL
jgi:ATPase family associated with various cellular activities (AAA)